MTGAFGTRVARAFRRAALPLAAYYAVTLALPLVNGARSGAFLRHALVVLVVPLICVAFACAMSAIVHVRVRAQEDGICPAMRSRFDEDRIAERLRRTCSSEVRAGATAGERVQSYKS